MTLINTALSADEVSIYSDTLTYVDGKPFALGGIKAGISADGTFTVATRGSVARGDRYELALCQCGSMDEAVSIARAALEIEAVKPPPDNSDNSGFDVFVAGYLHARGRMAAVQFRVPPGGALEELWLADGLTLQPEPVQERHKHRPGVWDDARAIKVAMAQQEITNRADLMMCIGGSLWRTTITRHGAEQRIVALFPTYRDDAALRGDPLAYAVAEFLGDDCMALAA